MRTLLHIQGSRPYSFLTSLSVIALETADERRNLHIGTPYQ